VLEMPPFKINHGAQMAKSRDRHDGIIHVVRGYRPLGVMERVNPEVGLRHAFATYQKLESGEGMRQTQADAIRLLMLVAWMGVLKQISAKTGEYELFCQNDGMYLIDGRCSDCGAEYSPEEIANAIIEEVA
jgi:hypothetical protein